MLKKTLYVLAAIIALLVIGFITQLKGDIPLDKLKADLAQPPSKFIRIDGMDVHYRDEGAGYPVVLVHGMSSSLHTWEDWTKVLSKKYRVVRMDLPGYGLTGPNANNDYSAAYYVKFMQEFLDSMGIKDCY
ncbi:MAG TPA: alpha/beta hydrolase, partial [Chitinophagales bacterium]|nr:alpha/beta hydrolase [Chitinophagales bacterium]